ncbi:formate-dependent phosphoribosylglycinamide formyltransferase [Candidatus Woesearchaeota archaeon]|nr:formate-dependent phosphoribosylglycinamide formyltransferase [Candidatus Woesearchaeota archaeon]
MIKELYSQTSGKAKKIMLLGCGELGKEVIIEAQRMGFCTIGVDRYMNAPGHQVAHKWYAGDMKNAGFLRSVVEKEKPDFIVPEIEAINLDMLMKLEEEGYNIIPNAKATHTAMQRERIRETIRKAGCLTSKYYYATGFDEFKDACEKVGYPCWTKAIMDSSGHGSSFVKGPGDVKAAYEKAKNEARGSGEKMIIEEHVPFDIEVTELAVRHYDENNKVTTSFPMPVGHYQTRGGDYHSSWQAAEVSEKAEKAIYDTAKKVTDALGGVGIFGCEMFVVGDKVYANECSPRPHDTGMVTFVTHQTGYSEAGLHVRAITGLPVPTEKRLGYNGIPMLTPGATHVVLSPYEGYDPAFGNLYPAFNAKGISFMLFGKPEAHTNRRMGIVLATAKDVHDAKIRAEKAAHMIEMRTRQNPAWMQQTDKEKHLIK